MSISGVSSITAYAHSGGGIQWQQEMHDYQALTIAIQSGNLISITKAFAVWQQDLRATATANAQTSKQTQPGGSNPQANANFQALSKALQTGDVPGAQSAFARLQKDLQAAGGALRNRANGGAAAVPTSGNSGITISNSPPMSNPSTTPTTTSPSDSASAPSPAEVPLNTLS